MGSAEWPASSKVTSKNDLGDVREWPDPTVDEPTVAFDPARYERLVAKAERVRDEVWANGIATTPDEIPFPKCGCYFCREEALDFSDASEPAPDQAESEPSPVASGVDT